MYSGPPVIQKFKYIFKTFADISAALSATRPRPASLCSDTRPAVSSLVVLEKLVTATAVVAGSEYRTTACTALFTHLQSKRLKIIGCKKRENMLVMGVSCIIILPGAIMRLGIDIN